MENQQEWEQALQEASSSNIQSLPLPTELEPVPGTSGLQQNLGLGQRYSPELSTSPSSNGSLSDNVSYTSSEESSSLKVQCEYKGCRASFQWDGHYKCIRHASCSTGGIYTPDNCKVCRRALKHLIRHPRQPQSWGFQLIRRRWDLVRKLASADGIQAMWNNPAQGRLLGIVRPKSKPKKASKSQKATQRSPPPQGGAAPNSPSSLFLSDTGEGPFLGFPDISPSPATPAHLSSEESIQVLSEATRAPSVVSDGQGLDIDIRETVSSAIDRALSVRFGPLDSTESREHGGIQGSSLPKEGGVAPLPGMSQAASSSAKVTSMGMEWYAIPWGWSVASTDSGDMLLRPTESGGFEQVKDVVLRHGSCPVRGTGWFYRLLTQGTQEPSLRRPSVKEAREAIASVAFSLGRPPVSKPVHTSSYAKSTHPPIVLSEDAVSPAQFWTEPLLKWWENLAVAPPGSQVPPPSTPQAEVVIQVPSTSSLQDFLSAPSVRVAPLPAGLSLISVEDARTDTLARQAALPLLSAANLAYDLASSLRRLSTLQRRQTLDVSALLASMAGIAEALTHLLRAPLTDSLVSALYARLRCRRAATSLLHPALTRELVQRDPLSPSVVPEDRARSVVASAPTSAFALPFRPKQNKRVARSVGGMNKRRYPASTGESKKTIQSPGPQAPPPSSKGSSSAPHQPFRGGFSRGRGTRKGASRTGSGATSGKQ